MRKIYLMVPVKTLFDENDKIQGRSDSKVSETAEVPIKEAKDYLRKLGEIITCVSPQERAIVTAKLCQISQWRMEDYLTDFDFGVFEAQKNFLLPRVSRNVPDDYGDFFSSYGYGGESSSAVSERLETGIKNHIAKLQNKEADLLYISGKHAIYTFYLHHREQNGKLLPASFFTPASIHTFTYSQGNFNYVTSAVFSQTVPVVSESEYYSW